jgi:hypothetical protein
MKNATMNTIYTALSNYGYDNVDVMTELYNEIHRYDSAKAEKAKVYEIAKPIVFDVFAQTDAPLTIAEIWEAIEDNAPEGFTKGKLSYAIAHQWASEVVKVEGKVNAYRKA